MDVTKDDLVEMRNAILAVVQEGFAGVHRRQDTTNGRVLKLEEAVGHIRVEAGKQDVRISNQDTRISDIGREVFKRRATDHHPVPAPPSPVAQPPITQRDAIVVGATVAATVAFLKFLAWIAPAAAVIKP